MIWRIFCSTICVCVCVWLVDHPSQGISKDTPSVQLYSDTILTCVVLPVCFHISSTRASTQLRYRNIFAWQSFVGIHFPSAMLQDLSQKAKKQAVRTRGRKREREKESRMLAPRKSLWSGNKPDPSQCPGCPYVKLLICSISAPFPSTLYVTIRPWRDVPPHSLRDRTGDCRKHSIAHFAVRQCCDDPMTQSQSWCWMGNVPSPPKWTVVERLLFRCLHWTVACGSATQRKGFSRKILPRVTSVLLSGKSLAVSAIWSEKSRHASDTSRFVSRRNC